MEEDDKGNAEDNEGDEDDDGGDGQEDNDDNDANGDKHHDTKPHPLRARGNALAWRSH